MLPVQLNEAQVAKVLTMTNNGIAFFNSYKLMPSGEIVWRINNQNLIQPQMQNPPIRAPPLQIRRPPIDEFVSDNIVELEEEIERLKKKKQQLNEKLAQLKYSYSLLEDPAKCLESSSKVDVSVQYMRNTYSLIDRKVNNLLINVDDTISEPKR
ncbi:hypothetical protein TVAG_317230 [Trichomonas vaginalis G3]|uniref:Uncharacterized protein n=1 Tax=Trichomonas vaginalis (strain ATCC PRA-98 / G3) TaxID=412133 RepID=A2FQZ8_TRIV3|nr:hypothetical protein TVAGG3_0744360 [Trichomonas vaginalis G3]EAX92665.1 hypothetical protein TVAG_317230 [Trichomonas vaginalis G3]KAI5512058.1 hypothetical protein TVAGG3_0744360 [Trichomonas vaginalis G3]|eukprot:XP_001305595.1 hypothetical protein [Trichomonas vaginalis G3]